jgi:hypothetical protein
MRRDRKREFVAGNENAAAFLLAKIEMLLELGERCNTIL